MTGGGTPALAIETRPAEDFASDDAGARIRRHRFRLGDDPEFLIYEGRDCTLFGRPPVFGIADGARFTVLAESVNYSSAERAFYRAAVSLDAGGRAMETIGPCCPLDNEFARNLWHWLTEAVPKVLMLEAFGFEGAYLIPDKLGFAREALTLAGVPADRIVDYTQASLYAPRLIFTEQVAGQFLNHRPALLGRLRAAFLARYNAPPPPMRRLYLARRDQRGVANEKDLMALLERHGFTRIYPEDYTLEQQIWVASNAEIVLGPHGAAMTLAFFMPPGGLVIELFSPNLINPTMFELTAMLGHRHHMVLGRHGGDLPYPYGDHAVAHLTHIALLLEQWQAGGASVLPDARNDRYRAALTAPS